ncbi:MAG: tripartite tricarboxylate transporter substrate binding protein, partial [Betaproteobacteria bacterium]|nr:tripartite tricarboxylate transporter substrate binding protein [Betaproteobacteria bacterium]
YPNKPIRLVIPFAPGGETDTIGRKWGNAVGPYLGESIVVENRPGAGGMNGSASVLRDPADGYTILCGQTTTHVINPIAMAKPPYDPLRDFSPICLISTSPAVIVANPKVANTLAELVAHAKANPGKLSYGTAGAGTISNLSGELFKLRAGGLDIPHVAYKGGAPALADIMGGHIPMGSLLLSAPLIGQHRGGRCKILAVTSSKRVAALPDVPTAIEAGIPDMVVMVFNFLLARAGSPKEATDTIAQVTQKAKASDQFRKDIVSAGAEVVDDSTPEKARELIRSETERWRPVIKQIGFKVE